MSDQQVKKNAARRVHTSDDESHFGDGKSPMHDIIIDVESGYECPRQRQYIQHISPQEDDEISGLARTALLILLALRTLMMIPRPGTVALAAANITAKMKGWDSAAAALIHAYATFFTTDVLLALVLIYHATRLQPKNVCLCASICFLWAVCAFNTQPEVVSYWRRVEEQQRAMDVLVAVVKNAHGAVTNS